MADKVDLFTKAALVARNPDRFEMISDLDETERNALAYERDHKWHGPKMLWYSIGLCAVGAATQGWDQTGSNGANLSWPVEFGLAYGPNHFPVSERGAFKTPRDEWIFGVVNAIIFLTAGMM